MSIVTKYDAEGKLQIFYSDNKDTVEVRKEVLLDLAKQVKGIKTTIEKILKT